MKDLVIFTQLSEIETQLTGGMLYSLHLRLIFALSALSSLYRVEVLEGGLRVEYGIDILWLR